MVLGKNVYEKTSKDCGKGIRRKGIKEQGRKFAMTYARKYARKLKMN